MLGTIVTIALALITAVLTFAMFRLNRTMTKIAEDEKKARTGHSLTITLPAAYGAQPSGGYHLRDITVVNNKNRTENIYKIFLKKDDKTIPFWHAVQIPLVIAPYDCKLVRANSKSPYFHDLREFKFFAVTSDKTIELERNIDCYNKPLD